MDGISQDQKIIAGIVVVALGLGALYYYSEQGDEESATASCVLTATGVTAIATGLSRGRTASAIIAAAGPTLSTFACKEVVDNLIEDPTSAVPVEVALGSGQMRSVDVTAGDFTLPSLSPPKTCADWIDSTAEAKCWNGQLSPPPF